MNPIPPTQDALPLGYVDDDAMPPFVRGSDTSEAAAVSMRCRSGSLRIRVLRWYARYGPATDDAMLESMILSHQTGVPRRRELAQRGWVVDTGQRAPTRTGRAAVLWEVTEAGRSVLADIDQQQE